MNRQRIRMGIAFRIDVLVKMILGDVAGKHFHATDFNDPVAIIGVKAGRFGIEYDLSHKSVLFFSLYSLLAINAPMYRSSRGILTRCPLPGATSTAAPSSFCMVFKGSTALPSG